MTAGGPILICGGGIGGLTLAIALARRGIPSQLFEARPEFPAEGAGIQLGPNATSILQALGIAQTLEPKTVSPEALAVHDAKSGDELTRMPLGPWIASRHGAPYWVAQRADVHGALREVAQALPQITVSTGRRLTAFEATAEAVSVQFGEDGGVAAGAVLIGADGLWSQVRAGLDPGFRLRYSGTIAARTVINREGLRPPFSDMATGVWFAPDAHVVHYPVAAGRKVALVAISRGPEPDAGWAAPLDDGEVARRFGHLHAGLTAFLSQGTEWRQWPLYGASPPPAWGSGRVALLGDAAHPILPFLAQGGAMAIEDAFVLADTIASHPDDPELALRRYIAERQPRARQVAAASEANGATYHLSGLQARGRNAVLRSTPGTLLMRRYDWVYGWRYQPHAHEIEL